MGKTPTAFSTQDALEDMMSTRCKFKCQSITKSCDWHGTEKFLFDAKFQAVTSGSPENNSFFAATPNGSLTVGTYRDDIFVPGKEYYIDIIEA